MRIFCDLDNVLLEYQGSEGFDKMPWTADGKALWDYLKPLNPIILSSAMLDRLGKSTREKCDWCAVELGEEVPVIVVPASVGKWPYSRPGSLLIDDSLFHSEAVADVRRRVRASHDCGRNDQGFDFRSK